MTQETRHGWGEWEQYQQKLGELLGKTYPLSKEATMAREPEWTLKLEEWGTNKEIEDLGYAHKKRSALQQEIARREQTMRRQQRHQQQLEIILAWRDAARYLKNNKKDIQYAQRQIIDIDQPKRTYRASRGKGHPNRPTKEYMDWNKGKSFQEEPTQVEKHASNSTNTNICTRRKKKASGNKKKTRPYRNHHAESREMENATTGRIAQEITRSSRQ